MNNEKDFDKLKDIERQKGYDAAIEQLRKMLNGEDPNEGEGGGNGSDGKTPQQPKGGDGGGNGGDDKKPQQPKGGDGGGNGGDGKGKEKQQQPKLNPDDQKIADENAKKKGKVGKGKDKDGKDKDGGDGKGGSGDDKGGNKAGTDPGDIEDRALDDELRRLAEETVEKYSKSLSGKLGSFVGKIRSSKKLERPDILANSQNGKNSWNQKLLLTCQAYVHSKLRNRKEYKNTYNRVRRGERAFTKADMRNGRAIIQGREEIKNKIGFDIALYFDVSGSMGGKLEHVFEAGYSIAEKLKFQFGKDKHVDRNKIDLKSFIFTTVMKKIPFGKKCEANGGTYAFDDLVHDVKERGDAAFLNIIITDGDFNNYSTEKAAKNMNEMEGMFVVVSNKPEGYFKELEKAANTYAVGKFAAIYADNDFTVK